MGEDEFSRPWCHRKVVDDVENYLNMQFQPKVMTRSRENDQKPHFLKNCLENKLEVDRSA